MEQQEQEFTKGFNNGYILAQFEPELLNKLLPDLKPGYDYTDGLLSGKEQYNLDKAREPIKDMTSHDAPDINKDDKDKER